jgi:hypothetical protein
VHHPLCSDDNSWCMCSSTEKYLGGDWSSNRTIQLPGLYDEESDEEDESDEEEGDLSVQ